MALETYDLAKEANHFHGTKAGVKGLVDSGITEIPKFFIHPKEDSTNISSKVSPVTDLEIPVIDLSVINDSQRHKEIVDKVCEAASSFGFFQLINHGISENILDAMLEGARAFHEGDPEIKSKLYTTENSNKVRFFSNHRLYKSAFGNWHDSLSCNFDGSLDFADIPLSCRKAMIEYRENLLDLSKIICELLSEGLGLTKDHLGSINAAQKQFLACHYYPPCPEPELAIGTRKHKDPCFLTILLQDSVGGLQICYQGNWINVTPVRGALLVNIGDLLQLVSNDKFKSVEHRVLANNTKGPRISIATFFNPKYEENKPYGPIKALLSDKNRPIYREVLFRDYMKQFTSENTNSSALDNYKI